MAPNTMSSAGRVSAVLAIMLAMMASTVAAQSIQGTYWKATELVGKATPAQDAKREAHLVFQTGGRVSGFDGCNRITGTYGLKGTAVTFGQMAGMQTACIDSAAEIERVSWASKA